MKNEETRNRENNIELLERIKLLKRVNARLEGMENVRVEEITRQKEVEEEEGLTLTVVEKEDERKEEDETDGEKGRKEVLDEEEKRYGNCD